MIKTKCTFSGFCKHMNAEYSMYDVNVAQFVSPPTFIKWFFSWAAAFKIDFRKDVDPWCKHSPKVLAGDGTHVGVSLRQMDITPIEQPDTEEVVMTRHRRYDRVLLFQRAGVSNQDLQRARTRLKAVCKTVVGEGDAAGNDPVEDRLLLDMCPSQEVREAVEGVQAHSFCHDVLVSLADVLFVLACDNPVSALLPYSCVDIVQQAVRDVCEGRPATSLEPVREVSPELLRLLVAAVRASADDRLRVCNFVLYVCDRVLQVHQEDPPAPEVSATGDMYNPPSGVAYYFTETGERVRHLRKYEMDGQRNEPDNRHPEERCSKVYPQVSSGGFSYMFLWFCPIHGHCYGFHLISGGEGRKDPFSSLVKYLREPPGVVFYDNACQLSEYCLNREPALFRKTRFFHDCFHGFSHKCAKTFRSSRVECLRVNSEICEQFNARLQCIKYTGSHLSQPRFVFLAQLVLHLWNKEKTELYQRKLRAACSGRQ